MIVSVFQKTRCLGIAFLMILSAITALNCSKSDILEAKKLAILHVKAINEHGVTVEDAMVTIDGIEVGETPFVDENVEAGPLTIRVSKIGFQIFVKEIDIEEGQEYTVEAVLRALPSEVGAVTGYCQR